jgi:hypothetical protein
MEFCEERSNWRKGREDRETRRKSATYRCWVLPVVVCGKAGASEMGFASHLPAQAWAFRRSEAAKKAMAVLRGKSPVTVSSGHLRRYLQFTATRNCEFVLQSRERVR